MKKRGAEGDHPPSQKHARHDIELMEAEARIEEMRARIEEAKEDAKARRKREDEEALARIEETKARTEESKARTEESKARTAAILEGAARSAAAGTSLSASQAWNDAAPRKTSLSDLLRLLGQEGAIPSVPDGLLQVIANIPDNWPEEDVVINSTKRAKSTVTFEKKYGVSVQLATELEMIEVNKNKVTVLGTQKLVLRLLGALSENGATVYRDCHAKVYMEENLRPDYLAFASEHADSVHAIVTVGDAKSRQNIVNGQLGKLLNYLTNVMRSQVTRPFIVGWLCDMKDIQLVCVIRERETFVTKTTESLPLLAHDSVAPGDGLRALAALTKSTNAQHSFIVPAGVSKFLAMGGSASVFLAQDKQSVLKRFLDDFRCFLQSEVDILKMLPGMFTTPAPLLGDHGKDVSDERIARQVAPPFLRLKGLLAADGLPLSSEAPAAILVLQPVGSALSRSAFYLCKFRAAVVRDYVNTLLILHSNNICHNDIRPSNLMLVDGGERGIVIDYGLAVHTTDADKHAEDLVKLVLVLVYWQTGNISSFNAVEFPLDFTAYERHLGDDWYAALTLASKCNHKGLLVALRKLVDPGSSLMSRKDASPPDESKARNRSARLAKIQGIVPESEEGQNSDDDVPVAGKRSGGRANAKADRGKKGKTTGKRGKQINVELKERKRADFFVR